MSDSGGDGDRAAFAELTAALPSLPRDEGGPVFHEPWEAQAFAMTLALYRRGLFTWPEWAAALSVEIKRAQQAGDPDRGDTYYRHWLAALEHLVADKGVTDRASLARYRDAWGHAAQRTPPDCPLGRPGGFLWNNFLSQKIGGGRGGPPPPPPLSRRRG